MPFIFSLTVFGHQNTMQKYNFFFTLANIIE